MAASMAARISFSAYNSSLSFSKDLTRNHSQFLSNQISRFDNSLSKWLLPTDNILIVCQNNDIMRYTGGNNYISRRGNKKNIAKAICSSLQREYCRQFGHTPKGSLASVVQSAVDRCLYHEFRTNDTLEFKLTARSKKSDAMMNIAFRIFVDGDYVDCSTAFEVYCPMLIPYRKSAAGYSGSSYALSGFRQAYDSLPSHLANEVFYLE